MIKDRIGRHEVLLPITHKNLNFREKKNSQVIKEIKKYNIVIVQGKKILHFEESPNLGVCTLFLSMVIETKVVIG